MSLTHRAALAFVGWTWACAAAWAAGSAVPTAPAPSPEQLYKNLAPSVWLVRSYDADSLLTGTGSAVVIAPDTLLTNCHVIKNASRVMVRNDNLLQEARLQHIDVARDMCQLTVRNLRAPAVLMGDSQQLNVGQRVFALGNPRGYELTLSDGLISALRKDENQRELQRIQISVPISPGSSGGGLFDIWGRLIGITTSTRTDAQNLNFAIPIHWQQELAARSDAAINAAQTAVRTATSLPSVNAGGASPSTPPGAGPSGGTAISVNDANAAPVTENCRNEYRKFLNASYPRAFAVTPKGYCGWASGPVSRNPVAGNSPDPKVRAMELCVALHKSDCSLYAVDGAVVYGRQP